MFGAPESPVAPPAVQAASVNGANGPASRERSLWEKEVLGFQFGDHPFMEAAAWLAGQLTHDTSQIGPEISGEKVKIAGLVINVRRIVTRNKSQMAVVVLEDLHGSIEGVVFPRVYERAAELFRDDAILIVKVALGIWMFAAARQIGSPRLSAERSAIWSRAEYRVLALGIVIYALAVALRSIYESVIRA